MRTQFGDRIEEALGVVAALTFLAVACVAFSFGRAVDVLATKPRPGPQPRRP